MFYTHLFPPCRSAAATLGVETQEATLTARIDVAAHSVRARGLPATARTVFLGRLRRRCDGFPSAAPISSIASISPCPKRYAHHHARRPRPLINIKDGVRGYVHKLHMSENLTPTNEVICPVCGQPMNLLHTIRRAFGENLNVFKCKPCGFSMTEPVSWTTPPSSQNAKAATAPHRKHGAEVHIVNTARANQDECRHSSTAVLRVSTCKATLPTTMGRKGPTMSLSASPAHPRTNASRQPENRQDSGECNE
jgi:hypothetical protein